MNACEYSAWLRVKALSISARTVLGKYYLMKAQWCLAICVLMKGENFTLKQFGKAQVIFEDHRSARAFYYPSRMALVLKKCPFLENIF